MHVFHEIHSGLRFRRGADDISSKNCTVAKAWGNSRPVQGCSANEEVKKIMYK
jgi:hypothetical protein